MNTFNIARSFENKQMRGWPFTFWCIDVHDTICKSTYERGHISREFYPHAKETLQRLTKIPEIKLILFTCSHRDDINQILEWLEENDIHFDYVNENPECVSNDVSNFQHKMYFNVLLDDKAGFEGETDWFLVDQELSNLYK